MALRFHFERSELMDGFTLQLFESYIII